MRTLRDLVTDHDLVWIYIGNDAEKEAFAAQCGDEGFHFSDGDAVAADRCGHVMALHNDLTLGNLAIFIWVMSFEDDVANTPLRVEYGKYAQGADDFVCKESYFRRA